jgi:hypothetical protein
VSAHQCLYSIQHMMFGRCHNSYPLSWSISAWKWTWLLLLFAITHIHYHGPLAHGNGHDSYCSFLILLCR